MAELRIVYTPDAENFRIDNLIPNLVRYVSDESSRTLRNSYQKLRAEMPDLPSKVGVVTFNVITKAFFRHRRLENPSTYYYPLDIFERILALEKEEDSLTGINYVRRETISLLSHYSILDNPWGEVRSMAIRIPTIPVLKKVVKKLQTLSQLDTIRSQREIIEPLEETYEMIKEIYNKSNFDNVRKMHEKLLKDFEQNKVSREFPLIYPPSGYAEPELCAVSLIDETEPLDSVKELFELAKKMGYKQTIDEFTKGSPKIDKFGETTYIDGLETLLESLPQPKIIITDTYVVTLFPQLNGHQFSTHEFRV